MSNGYDFNGIKYEKTQETTISNDGFFADVSTDPFYTRYRIPSEIPPETVIEHLSMAMIVINRQLKTYRETQEALGFSTITDVPAALISGKSENTYLYERAVYCTAKAEILRETQTVDRRSAAENIAKTSEETADKYHEYAADAVRLLIGQPTIGVHEA